MLGDTQKTPDIKTLSIITRNCYAGGRTGPGFSYDLAATIRGCDPALRRTPLDPLHGRPEATIARYMNGRMPASFARELLDGLERSDELVKALDAQPRKLERLADELRPWAPYAEPDNAAYVLEGLFSEALRSIAEGGAAGKGRSADTAATPRRTPRDDTSAEGDGEPETAGETQAERVEEHVEEDTGEKRLALKGGRIVIGHAGSVVVNAAPAAVTMPIPVVQPAPLPPLDQWDEHYYQLIVTHGTGGLDAGRLTVPQGDTPRVHAPDPIPAMIQGWRASRILRALLPLPAVIYATDPANGDRAALVKIDDVRLDGGAYAISFHTIRALPAAPFRDPATACLLDVDVYKPVTTLMKPAWSLRDINLPDTLRRLGINTITLQQWRGIANR